MTTTRKVSKTIEKRRAAAERGEAMTQSNAVKKVKKRGFADAPHYSTAASARWWARINRIMTVDHRLAYGIGCALQEIELRLLEALDEIEQRTGAS